MPVDAIAVHRGLELLTWPCGVSRSVTDATCQSEFFEVSGAKRLIDAALDGYSATIFAYGQTGAGKTHTIAGPEGRTPPTLGSEHAGLIPRTCEYIVARAQALAGTCCKFRASFLEIYNDQAYDLLNPAAGVNLMSLFVLCAPAAI